MTIEELIECLKCNNSGTEVRFKVSGAQCEFESAVFTSKSLGNKTKLPGGGSREEYFTIELKLPKGTTLQSLDEYGR